MRDDDADLMVDVLIEENRRRQRQRIAGNSKAALDVQSLGP